MGLTSAPSARPGLGTESSLMGGEGPPNQFVGGGLRPCVPGQPRFRIHQAGHPQCPTWPPRPTPLVNFCTTDPTLVYTVIAEKHRFLYTPGWTPPAWCIENARFLYTRHEGIHQAGARTFQKYFPGPTPIVVYTPRSWCIQTRRENALWPWTATHGLPVKFQGFGHV